MLRRHSLAIALSLFAAACASSDAAKENLDTTEEALVDCTDDTLVCADDEDAPPAHVSTLVSWNGISGVLTFNEGGVMRTASVLPITRVRRAPILRFDSGDPVRPLVEQWNELIPRPGRTIFGPTAASLDSSVTTFTALTGSLANAGAHMRVKVNANNVVKALRPVP